MVWAHSRESLWERKMTTHFVGGKLMRWASASSPVTSLWGHTPQSVMRYHCSAMDQGYLHTHSFALARALFKQRCDENFQVNQKAWPRITRGNHIHSGRNLPRLYRVRLFTSLDMLDINHWFSNLNGHENPQEGLLTQGLLGAHSKVGLGWSLSVCISNRVPGDADSAWPRDHTLRNTAKVLCHSEYGPWTSSISISWMLVGSANAQALHQIHWIMVCILTSSLSDLFTR